MMFTNDKLKKGFTLVECVIAMLVITIITAVAISVFQTTSISTASQWNNYEVTQYTNNAIACFQGSDSMDDFVATLGCLNEAVNSDASGTKSIEISRGSYFDYPKDASTISTPITRLTVSDAGYASGNYTLTFYNGETAVKTLNYKDSKSVLKATSGSMKTSGLYDFTGVAPSDATETDSITVTYTKDSRTDTYFVDEDTISIMQSTGNNVSFTPTSLESYLLSQNQVLVYDSSAMTAGNITLYYKYYGSVKSNTFPVTLFDQVNTYMYFTVYDAKTKAPAKNAQGQNLYIRVKCNQNFTDSSSIFYYFKAGSVTVGSTHYCYDSSCSDESQARDYVTPVWTDKTNGYFTVSSVEYVYANSLDKNATFSKFYGVGGETFENYQWFGLPLYLWDLYVDNSVSNYQGITVDSYTGNFEFKSGVTSDVAYLTTDGSSYVSFYNTPANGAGEGNLLLTYNMAVNANDITAINNAFQFYDSIDYTESDGYMYYYKNLTKNAINAVRFNDSTKTIDFLNAYDDVTISFTLDATDYQTSKAHMCNDNGLYRACFTGSPDASGKMLCSDTVKGGKLIYMEIPARNGNLIEYQVSVIVESGELTSTYVLLSAQGTKNTGSKSYQEIEIVENKSIPYTTKYYVHTKGTTGCFLSVTYSKYGYDVVTEPRLRIWIMSTSELIDFLDERSADEEPEDEPFIDYRKG